MNELIEFCKNNHGEIFSNHQLERKEDLGMLKRYADMYDLDSNSVERIILNKAKDVGLI